jgi:Group II intron, maturase-specific domain
MSTATPPGTVRRALSRLGQEVEREGSCAIRTRHPHPAHTDNANPAGEHPRQPPVVVLTLPVANTPARVQLTWRSTRRSTYQSLDILMHRLNPVLRGWTNYHRHGAASKTFAYLGAYTWRRVWIWLRTKHPKATVRDLQQRYLNRWWPAQDGVELFNPAAVAIIRYRYRGAAIPTPWATTTGAAV